MSKLHCNVFNDHYVLLAPLVKAKFSGKVWDPITFHPYCPPASAAIAQTAQVLGFVARATSLILSILQHFLWSISSTTFYT